MQFGLKQLITGGARSGKSSLAKEKALAWQKRTGGQVVVIATAEQVVQAESGESCSMAKRIAHHQLHRPNNWKLIESSEDLAQTLALTSDERTLIIVDCLTLWTSSQLVQGEQVWRDAKSSLIESLRLLPGPVIFIGNEVGQSVVPMGEFNRLFVDELGWLHQHLGKVVDVVITTIAGLPLVLKASEEDIKDDICSVKRGVS